MSDVVALVNRITAAVRAREGLTLDDAEVVTLAAMISVLYREGKAE